MKWYEKAAEAGKKFVNGVVEVAHVALDVAGCIPGVGAVPDLVNAGIYALEGDGWNAAFSLAAAVPVVGDAAAVGKIAKRVDGAVDAVKGLKNLAAFDKVKPLINVLKGKLDELFKLLDFSDEIRKLMNKMLNKISGLMKEGGKLLSKIGKKAKQKLIKLKNKIKNLFKKCFVGETLVKTESGYQEIREIQKGDSVYSRNEETGETGLKQVKSIARNKAHTIYTIRLEDGNEIKTTAYHSFYMEGRGWVNAINLEEGDYVATEEGEICITEVFKERKEEPVPVYNFHVEDWETYFVSLGKIYVHNGKCPNGKRFIDELTPEELSKLTPEQLKESLPEGWTYNGSPDGKFIHIKDEKGNYRVRVDPPDKVTNYPHMHILDKDGNAIDINGKIVPPNSPDAHIPR